MAHNYQRTAVTTTTPVGATKFIELLQQLLQIGDRQVRLRPPGSGSSQIFINYINLPKGVGGAGGGAEAENNRMMFVVSGFDRNDAEQPPPSGKLKIEMSVSALPREYKMRAKTADPVAIAKYLADFLNKIAKEVPPNFTHTRA